MSFLDALDAVDALDHRDVAMVLALLIAVLTWIHSCHLSRRVRRLEDHAGLGRCGVGRHHPSLVEWYDGEIGGRFRA